jgi:hypothetical protein
MQKMNLGKLQTRKMKGLKQKSWTQTTGDKKTVEPDSEPEVDPPKKKRKVAKKDEDSD